MSMIDTLLKRLHRVFDKDPKVTSVVTLANAPSEGISIKNLTLTCGATTIDLSSITVSQLVAAINSGTTVTATLAASEYGSMLARGLADETGITATLHYPTALLYNEMRVYGWTLQDQADRLRDIEAQMYLHRAGGSWLDFWGRDMFGIERFNNESDAAYQIRLIHEIGRPTQNNVALAQIVWDALGVTVRIVDAVPNISEIPPEQQGNAVGRFLLDMSIDSNLTPEEAQVLIDRVKAVVRKYKAAGTDFIETALRKLVQNSENVTASESYSIDIVAGIDEGLLDGPIFVGAGWVVGTPDLLVGTNDAMKEQAKVTVLDTGNTAISQSIYGG